MRRLLSMSWSWPQNVVSLWSAAIVAGALAGAACAAGDTTPESQGVGGGGVTPVTSSVGNGPSSTTGNPSSTTGPGSTGSQTGASSTSVSVGTTSSTSGTSTTSTASTTGGSQSAGSGGSGGGSVCAAGTMDCSGSCVSPETDNANCGACGTICQTGESCTNGACACMTGRTLCTGACVDLETSSDHCGTCTTACATGQTCTNGACACATGQTSCTGVCKSLMTDAANCGACGKACATGQTCTNGACACATGQTSCSGICKSLMTDAANCGACGKACATGQTCASGACTGGTTTTTACKYASGLNVAWVNFANDIPNPNLTTFKTIFTNTHAAGGRVIRWWFHTNGTVTPGYDASGKALAVTAAQIADVKSILSAANAAGVAINISLWSFDMLQGSSENISAATTTNNTNLLQVDANRQAYIDNYLTPLVTALKGTPGLYSYEIFNEPEGMGPNGWSATRTTEAYIQKTVNWFASAIHTADPNVLVTNGAVTFDYCSYATGKTNDYSDAALRAAGGKQNGILDFYEVHYYTSNGASNSPFTHAASTWGLAKDNKNLVIGEFAAQATDGVALNDLFTTLYNGGYNGSWAWAYTTDWPWPAMQTPMQNLYTAQTATVGACP